MKANTAVLLVDHGSRLDEANEVLEKVAERLRQRSPGCIVEVAHMELASPDIAEGLERCVQQGATRVIVHPFMLTPGRHASEDVPRLVDQAASSHPNVVCHVTEALGAHEGICQAVLDCVLAVDGDGGVDGDARHLP